MALRAATTFYWRGTTSTAYNVHTNWIVTGGGAPDASDYPGYDSSEATAVAGDSVVFDIDTTNGVAGGDYSAAGDLALIQVYPAYAQLIGSSAAPLLVDMQAAGHVRIDQFGAEANRYLKGGGAQGLVDVKVTGDNLAYTLSLDGTVAGLVLDGGLINIEASATVSTTLNVNGNADVTIEASATIPATIQFNVGKMVCNVAVTTLNMFSGHWDQAAGAVTTLNKYGGYYEGNAAVTTVNHYAGYYDWQEGTITTLNGYGGQVDGSGSVLARTLTNGTLYAGCTLNLDNGLNNIAATNPISIQGGTLRVSPGATLAIA